MKYLKIKEPYENNILIMKVHHEEKDCYVCEYKYSDIWLRASKDWVIAQANTIEELCDGFIGITTKEYPNRPDIEPSIHYFQKPFEFMYGDNIFKNLKLIDVELKNQNGWSYPTKEWFETCDIYGFIRTSKGLIYVAKLNEKGELELI